MSFDRELNLEYDFAGLLAKLPFLEKTWLKEFPYPRVLITQADNWLGYYLINILTQSFLPLEVLVLGRKTVPKYLDLPKYAKVNYQQFSSWSKGIDQVLEKFQPHLIFHSDCVWDLHDSAPMKTYQYNIGGGHHLCSAAEKYGVRRIIMFSDSCLYGRTYQQVEENYSPGNTTTLGKSFWELEQITSQYKSNNLETYHLRFAPLYGPYVPSGLMLVSHLLTEGMLLGNIEGTAAKQVSYLSAKNLALGAFILAFAPQPGDRIFNLAEGSIGFSELLTKMASEISPKKILGFSTKIAKIFQIGYQSEIALSENFYRLLGSLGEEFSEIHNQIHFQQQIPKVSKEIMEYILCSAHLQTKRWRDSFGWEPEVCPSFLEQTKEQIVSGDWHQQYFAVGKLSPKEEKRIRWLDELQPLAQKISEYVPQRDDPAQTVTIPQTNWEIDSKSLWLISEIAWQQFLVEMLRSKSSSGILHLLTDLFPVVSSNLLHLIKYETYLAKKIHPDIASQWGFLMGNFGHWNYKKTKYYVTMAILFYLQESIEEITQKYSQMIPFLPEKRYGLYLGDERGDIGIIIQVKNGYMHVSFPRRNVDSISRSHYLPKRIREFKKSARLHFVIGIRFQKLLTDLTQESFFHSVLGSLGTDYLVAEDSEYYRLLIKMASRGTSQGNAYCFLSTDRHILLGCKWQDRHLSILPKSRTKAIETMLQTWEDEEVASMLERATNGKERFVFISANTAKKIFESFLTPSRLRKFALNFMDLRMNRDDKGK